MGIGSFANGDDRREAGAHRGRRSLAGLIAGLLLAHAASPASALVFVATNTNDSGVGSLRQAIINADASLGPDEVAFALPGCPCTITVLSTLLVNESLTITGPGAGNLSLHGGDLVQVLRSGPGATLTVSDLTVRNGRDAIGGGGIFASDSLTLDGVIVRNSNAPSGGGIYAIGSATLVDSIVRDNVATTGDGGGLLAAALLNVTGSQFIANQAPLQNGGGGGGGIMAFSASTITDTDFVNNSVADWGGGAYLADFAQTTPTVLDDVRFLGNTAQTGGGGGLFVWFAAALTDVEAIGNYAGYRGGGIYGSYSANYGLSVTGGRLMNNSGAGGGGLYADGDITVDGTELTGNLSRGGNGGAMYTLTNAVVSNVSVFGNTVLNFGNSGGIDTLGNLTITSSTLSGNQSLAGSGGGSGAGGSATVTDCLYEDNFAQVNGGGLLAFGTATVTDSQIRGNVVNNGAGGIFATNAVIASSEITGNAAPLNVGGGAYVSQNATVTDTLFEGNTANSTGGGLHVQSGAAVVTGGRFEGNLVTNSGRGGGLYCIGTSCQVDGTEFVGNIAEHRGGAVATGGSFSVTGALFEDNEAVFWGGAIYATGGVDVQRSRFLGNEAGDLGGAIYHNGGSGGEIANSLFARNQATSGLGEAIALNSAGPYAILHSTVAAHPGQAAGSALYVNANTVDVRNNIIASHATGILRDAGGTVTANYNLFHGNGAEVSGSSITNANAIAGAPDFVNPANDDYHLSIGSAALDAGPDVGTIVDTDGESRPQGAGFDLGFDELSLGAPTGCPATPAAACGTAASDVLQIAINDDPAKTKLALKHLRATSALTPADFGDPVAGGNAYQLCMYDASAGTPALVASMVVPGGGQCGAKPCWKALAGKGFAFKDKTGSHDGITQLVLRGGAAGKGALLLKGVGTGLALPEKKMEGIPYLDADPGVTVQLHESSTGGCWESSVMGEDVQTNTEAQFKGTRK
jgi:predicted outer membrane repeat protein